MKSETTKLRNKLDKMWRTVGKEDAVCEICASDCRKQYNYNQLHPHHMISRKKSLTRWDLKNRLWVCPSHHTLSDQCVEYNQKGWFWNDESNKDWLGTHEPALKGWLQETSVKANQTKKWKISELRELLSDYENMLENL